VRCYDPSVSRSNLFGLDLQALGEIVAALGEPGFRARQLYGWLYRRRVRTISEMSNLSRGLRQRLEASHQLRWPAAVTSNESKDGTRKYLFGLEDGATIESVYIPEETRRTICISTQAGCPLRCAFCLTGIAGYRRNLKPFEILGQVAQVMAESPARETGWNVVVMGMGEPLLNYENTMAALRILMDPAGFAVTPKKLTLSTVGILPALEKMAQEPVRPNLAISLHAPNAVLRRSLMPIEEKYPLPEVIAAALRYPSPKGGMVTFEYVMLGGINDSPAQARELALLLGGSRAKVNLIPLNPAPEIPFRAPTDSAIDAFCKVLAGTALTVSVRRSRGADILAACGQLHLKSTALAS
jgi:23S rRNA (adenine2503-C2)-methyltransferase